MTLGVKSGGIWKTPTALSVKSGGLWKTVTAGYVKSGGLWKQFWTLAATGTLFPAPGGRAIEVEGGKIILSGGLSLATNGAITGGGYSGGDWFAPLTAGIGNSYYVRFSKVGTGNFSGSALGVWLALSSIRALSVATTSTVASASGTITVELSLNGVTVAASADVNYVLAHTT